MDTLTVKKVSDEVYMEIDCDGGSCLNYRTTLLSTVPGKAIYVSS